MSRIPAWFGRKFDLTFPADQYPNLCVRLRGTPGRLEEILRGVPRNVLVAKVGDKWSAQEHAGHLLDLESLWMARVDDFVRGGETLTVADRSNRKTYEANHNARALRGILAEFREGSGRRLHEQRWLAQCLNSKLRSSRDLSTSAQGEDRNEAIFRTAAMIGAIVLARPVDAALSDEILKSVRQKIG